MRFLLDSHRYFETRASVPFVPSAVAILMTAGFNFLAAVIGLAWASTASVESGLSAAGDISVSTFSYVFLTPFVGWVVFAGLFYAFILLNGRVRVGYFTQLNVVGIGFIPLEFASALEVGLTSYYALTVTATTPPNSALVLRAGGFGVGPTLLVAVVYLLALLWSGHVWNGAVQQLGRVSPRLSTAFVTTLVGVAFVERVVVIL